MDGQFPSLYLASLMRNPIFRFNPIALCHMQETFAMADRNQAEKAGVATAVCMAVVDASALGESFRCN